MLKWSNLRGWGSSRLIQTSYVWIVFVPIAAKVLHPIEGEHTIRILASAFQIHLALPFSWRAFFFMSLAFASGTLVYTLRCPEIVRRFASFMEYRNAHLGHGPLYRWHVNLVFECKPADLRTIHVTTYDALRISTSDPDWKSIGVAGEAVLKEPTHARRSDLLETYQRVLKRSRLPEDCVSDYFDAVRHAADSQRIGWMWLAACFFGSGFALFLVVLVQSTAYVIGWADS